MEGGREGQRETDIEARGKEARGKKPFKGTP